MNMKKQHQLKPLITIVLILCCCQLSACSKQSPATPDISMQMEQEIVGISYPPVVVGEWVIVGSHNGSVYALDKETGRLYWQTFIGVKPRAKNLMLYPWYISHEGQQIISFGRGGNARIDLATGKIIDWNAAATITIGTVGSDELIEYPLENSIARVRPDNHEKVWQRQFDVSCYGNAVVSNNKLFVGTKSGVLYCIDIETGQDVWKYNVEGKHNAIMARPAVCKDLIIFAPTNGTIYACDQTSGKEIWKTTFPPTRNKMISSPSTMLLFSMTWSWFAQTMGICYACRRRTGERYGTRTLKSLSPNVSRRETIAYMSGRPMVVYTRFASTTAVSCGMRNWPGNYP